MTATALPALCICLPRHINGTDYLLHFPVSEVANAIALCGWTLANDLPDAPEVQQAIRTARAADSLPIPDGAVWFGQYATRTAGAPQTQAEKDIAAAERLYIRGHFPRGAYKKVLAHIFKGA